jgi:hypothetical protein
MEEGGWLVMRRIKHVTVALTLATATAMAAAAGPAVAGVETSPYS